MQPTSLGTTRPEEMIGSRSQGERMPVAIYMFAVTAFALGLAEFVPIGLSDVMAGSLGVSNESIGAIVSIYALGATISAPILSALTAGWARKRVMLATALVFSLGSFVAAMSNDLNLMIAARFVAGLGHGLFLAVATSVAAQLVGGKRSGTAVALVFGGFTVALAVGVPIGTWLGTLVSWRPLLIEVTGASMGTVSAFMLVYGVMAAIGNIVGGKVTDSMGANGASLIVVAGIAVTTLSMFLFANSIIAMAISTAILGLLTFGAVPPLQARLLSLAEEYTPQSVGVASGLNIAGFNSGIVFGSAIGGVTMGSFGVASTALVATIAAGLGTLILVAQLRK